MAKPATLPRWADVGGGAGGVGGDEPLSGEKDTGWVANQVPPAEYFNWLGYWTYKWCQYLDTLEAEALTWTALHTFTAGAEFYGVTSTPGLTAAPAAHASGVGIYAAGNSTAGSIAIKATANHASNYAVVAWNDTAGPAVYAGVPLVSPGSNHSGVYALGKGTGYGVLGEAISTAGGIQGKVGSASGSADVWGVHGNGNVNGTGIYGIGGSTIGDGVRAVAGNAVWPALRATGYAGSSPATAGDIYGGTGTTTGGTALTTTGGAGVTNGNGGIGLNVIGGAAAGTGNAGTGLLVTSGTKASGTFADAIKVNAPGGGTIDASTGFYGLNLDAGTEIKFRGTRTNYGNGLKNVLTAKNMVAAWGKILLNPAGTITVQNSYNVTSVVFSSGGLGPYIDVSITAMDGTHYMILPVANGTHDVAVIGSPTTTGFQLQLLDEAKAGEDATTVASTTIQFLVVGNMAP